MMNVKKYRAETTREALEKIKMDIGDDAFVLETKQVKAGGFLGIGAKTQVEISAMSSREGTASNSNVQKSDFASSLVLNITDSTPAMPFPSGKKEKSAELKNGSEKLDLKGALKSRAEAIVNFDSLMPKTRSYGAATARAKEIDVVEMSSEAPKIIHDKNSLLDRGIESQNLTAESYGEVSRVRVSRGDLDLLRAELRDIKFSLNSFTALQSFKQSNLEVELGKTSALRKPPFADAFAELTGLGVSTAIAKSLITKIVPKVKSGAVAKADISRASLEEGIESLIKFGDDPLKGEEPAILAVIGSTGVGKTTTIAKLAARIALDERRPVELVTLDTYRIAAVEQLVTYAEIIGAGCHVVRSVLELDGLIRRFPAETTVLIDTTGKNPHDLADQHEFSSYLNKHKEIRKCLAIQATTHPVDAVAAIKKFEMYGADCLALTKLDETTRPGATLELIAESGLPLTYLCTGQRVPEDLKAATPQNYAARIFGETI